MKKTFSFLAINLFIVSAILAQGGPPATPIDGGLGILLVAGAAYGIKKIRDKRKEG